MAYTTFYTMTFRSVKNLLYTVNIMKNGTPSNVVNLTPAEHPFTVDENAADDPFTPVRGQTGYLRISANISASDSSATDGDTMTLAEAEGLVPTSPTSHLIVLYYGGTRMWQGYLKPMSFNMAWELGRQTLELPIASPLAILEDMEFPISSLGVYSNIANIIYVMFRKFPTFDSFFYDYIYMSERERLNRYGYAPSIPAWLSVNAMLLGDTKEIKDESDTTITTVGKTCAEVLEMVLKPFGMVVRESCFHAEKTYIGAPALFFFYPDDIAINSVYPMLRFTSTQWATLAGGSSIPSPTELLEYTANILDTAEFAGEGHSTDFINALRSRINVSLKVADWNDYTVELPSMLNNAAATVYDVDCEDETVLHIQPQCSNTANSFETVNNQTFRCLKALMQGTGCASATDTPNTMASPWVAYGSSGTFADVISTSVITARYDSTGVFRYQRPNNSVGWLAATNTAVGWGAMPVRYYVQSGDEAWRTMNDGIFLHQQDLRNFSTNGVDPTSPKSAIDIANGEAYYNVSLQSIVNTSTAIYSIRSRYVSAYFGEGSYFNINFDLLALTISRDGNLFCGNYDYYLTTLFCRLKVGNYYWAGENGWSTSVNYFAIYTDVNGKIDASANTVADISSIAIDPQHGDGWLVPVMDGGMSGQVTFEIMSFCKRSNGQNRTVEGRCHIISNLTVEFCPPIKPAYPDTGSNNYTEATGVNGSQREETIDFGTFNQNRKDSPSFLKSYSLSTFEYSNSTYVQTPLLSNAAYTYERSLAKRMALYHNTVRTKRHAILMKDKGTTTPSNNTILSPLYRFIYDSKYFIQILSHVDFADDTMEVDYIETNG